MIVSPRPDSRETRREADRVAYLDCQRAAHQMRLDALQWQSLRDELIADPSVYGKRAADYKAGVAARLDVVINWCFVEAARQDAYAAQYAEILGASA